MVSYRKIILICVSVILIALFILFILEKTHITNFYTKNNIVSTSPEVRPVNSVENKPATTTEQDEGNQIKQNLIDNANNPAKPSGKIDISLSAANQDTTGGPLIIRSIVSATSGTCTLSITNGATVRTYTSEVINQGTYYSCKGFDISMSDLSNGKWQLKLSVSNSTASGEITQEVEIKS